MDNELLTISKNGFDIPAYIAVTDGVNATEKAPAIIIVHEIWGMTENIKTVADRFSREGYIAVAPDLFAGTELGDLISPDLLNQLQNPETRDETQKKVRAAITPATSPEFGQLSLSKLKSVFDYLQSHELCNGKVSIVGFCFGGTFSFALAGAEPNLHKAIGFYGQPPSEEAIATIQCPVLALYGEKDERLIQSLPAFTELMKNYNKDFKSIVYPNAGHAFFNDQNKMMYNADAAEKAWEEVKFFLKDNEAEIGNEI